VKRNRWNCVYVKVWFFFFGGGGGGNKMMEVTRDSREPTSL
jgi:hypothetical protein